MALRLSAKKAKYRARPTVVNGIRFHSAREAARYLDLKLREKAGEIKELELQPKFPIYVCRRQNGELHKVCDLILDFRYREGPCGLLVVEDCKGMRLPIYKLKKRMFEAQYGLEIRET
jgi:hypothetical protein